VLLSSKDLTELPPQLLAGLTALEHLDVSNNMLGALQLLPAAIWQLPSLRHLSLAHNALQLLPAVPAGCAAASALQVLCLYSNLLLAELPGSMSRLTGLTTLSLQPYPKGIGKLLAEVGARERAAVSARDPGPQSAVRRGHWGWDDLPGTMAAMYARACTERQTRMTEVAQELWSDVDEGYDESEDEEW
jgi:hypothetical protein